MISQEGEDILMCLVNGYWFFPAYSVAAATQI